MDVDGGETSSLHITFKGLVPRACRIENVMMSAVRAGIPRVCVRPVSSRSTSRRRYGDGHVVHRGAKVALTPECTEPARCRRPEIE